MKTRKDREEGLKNRRWGSSKVNFYFGFHQGYYQELWGLMHGLDPSMHSTPPLPSAFLCFILLLWRLLSLLLCVSVTSTAQSSQDLHLRKVQIYSVQFSPVAQSCLTLCDPMDFSTPGFLFHHQHSELAQTHIHRVSDAIQPSHPLSSPSPPALNLSQHQGLFK